ncbi:unnamed protein product [Aureobasidium mustum]|uniref:DUF7907 domain-containing protein n=1 Tax=Aureobasidium mustum TaxID=2773714 RepID=A0A9N8K958_9PEZI|nr:unnamed protein product [Aureobasidium mustum]
MYTSIKTLAAAIVLPLVAALPLSQHNEAAVFDSSKPFTLHTEVVNATSAFNDLYLTSFHTGAGQSTVIGSKNSSIAIGWDLSNSILSQPISISGEPGFNYAYNLSLVDQAPFRSNAPSGYDYISLGVSGVPTTGFYFNNSTLAWSGSNSTAPDSFDGCFAICHVNGTAPYFTLGREYQLLWKTNNASSTSSICADVKLIGANIA